MMVSNLFLIFNKILFKPYSHAVNNFKSLLYIRASLLCEMERRVNAMRNAALEPPGGTRVKLIDVTSEVLKETALSHQSETKV